MMLVVMIVLWQWFKWWMFGFRDEARVEKLQLQLLDTWREYYSFSLSLFYSL